MKILVVEDDASGMMMVRAAIQKMGHEVITASSGEEAAEAFRSARPRMVISDWMMPGISGIDLCRLVRSNSDEEYTYFVLITSRSSREDRIQALEAGCDDFLGKPIDIGELQARVRVGERIIESDRRRREAESEAARRNEYLQTVISNAPVGLWALDKNGVFELAEGTALHAVSDNPETLLGKSFFEVYADFPRVSQAVQAVLKGRQLDTITQVGDKFFENRFMPRYGPDGELQGAIGVATDVTERHQSQIRLREALEGLEEARRLEHNIAANIQSQLLIEAPPSESSGFDVQCYSQPSQGLDGDFYDFYLYAEGILDVVVGDSMGKGVPAGLIGAATKSAIPKVIARLMTQTTTGFMPSVESIVNEVHRQVTPELIKLDSFVTLVYARFNLHEKSLSIVNCGHTNLMMIEGLSGTIKQIRSTGSPLGFRESDVFVATKVDIEDSDVFVFYSDGVTEARNQHGEFFGDQRLADLLLPERRSDSKQILERIVQGTQEFVGDEAIQDDLTCVVVRAARCRSVVIPRKLDQLRRIRELTRSLLRRAGANPESQEFSDFELAVVEASTNVIRHCLRQQPEDHYMELSFDMNDHTAYVRVTYSGEEFQPGEVDFPGIQGDTEGGFGLYIIERCADEVVYSYDEGRNTILLGKRIKGASKAVKTNPK
ncbi:MAG: SpoIIE family protein phosphatase [Fimbriimonadaceae bacterium]